MTEEEKTSEEESKSSEEKDKQGNEDQKGLTDEQFKALTEDDRFKELFSKEVQSEKDKAVATIQRRQTQDRQSEIAKLRQQREQDELERLVDSGDTDELGVRQAESIKHQRTMRDAASQVSGTIEGVLAEHPEFRVIGNDKIEEIRQDLVSKGGTVVDFMVALANERQGLAVGVAAKEAAEVALKEVDARLVEAGLKKRSEDKGPDENVSGAGGTSGGDTRTEDEILADPDTELPVLEKILKERGIKVK